MIGDLPPYPTLKYSGVEFLGEVPEHWEVRPAKWLYREVDERSVSGDEELLSVSHLTGVTPRSQKNITMFMAASYAGHKVCRPGDLVINTMWAWAGALGVSRHVGIVSPAYGVYRPLPKAALLSEYADLLLRTRPYVGEYTRRSTGIQASRLRLYPEQFLQIGLVCPSPLEQEGIIRFLADVDRRIGRYVRAKQRLIALLAEKRQVMVDAAVRSDGTRSRRLAVTSDLVKRPVDRRGEALYTPIGLLNRGRGVFLKQPTKGSELGDSTFFWVEEGDFILSGQFAWEGAIALAGQENAGCVASHRYPILRGKPSWVDSAYLLAFFKTGLGQLLLDHHSRGAAGRNRPLNIRTLMKETIPIPSLGLQAEIAATVHLEAQMNRAVARTVGMLREYRARLIMDVATGRIDVREAASGLPDETQEPGVLDATISLFDIDDDVDDDAETASAQAQV